MAEIPLDVRAVPPGCGTGCLPRNTKLGDRWPILEDQLTEIPEADWPELIEQQRSMEWLVWEVLNQKSTNSCTANATAQGIETICNRQAKQQIPLSQASIYKMINGGRDAGSSIDDALEQIATDGALPADTAENKARFAHTFPRLDWRASLPDGWRETAGLFKGLEWFDIGGARGLVTAVLLGHPVVTGRDGHALCYLAVVRLPDGSFALVYVNSWGQWGVAGGSMSYGFGRDSLARVDRGIRSYGGWALRSANLAGLLDLPAPQN